MESFNCPNCNEHVISDYENLTKTCKCFYKFQIIKDDHDNFMLADMYLNEDTDIVLVITKKTKQEKFKYELMIYENREWHCNSYFFDEFSKENIEKVKNNIMFV